ncbi:MAG: hypothetical protein IKC82_07205 [Lentisphaeria bacterium]|nr:hypothetical protein [Lentisphaeria bacterium]
MSIKSIMSIKSMTVVNGGYAFCFYEAFCGIAAKYEAHQTMHEARLRRMKQILTDLCFLPDGKKMVAVM